MIKKIVLEIYNALCYLISCNKEKIKTLSMVQEILQIEFKEINRQKTDCFHIDELEYFLKSISCHNFEINENLNIYGPKDKFREWLTLS